MFPDEIEREFRAGVAAHDLPLDNAKPDVQYVPKPFSVRYQLFL
jgi:hypothetical protein